MENVEKNVIDAEINEEDTIYVPEEKSVWQKFKNGIKTNGPKIAIAVGEVILIAASFALGIKVGSTKLDDEPLLANARGFNGSDDYTDNDKTDDEEMTV